MVLGEAFIDDEQKFPPQVGLDIAVPWRVVPGDLSFPGFVLSSGLLFLRNEFKFEVVATFLLHNCIFIISPALSVNGHSLILPDECGRSWPYETEL